MAAGFFAGLEGKRALLVGGGDGLARALRQRYDQVIAADPSRSLGAAPSPLLLKEGEVTVATGKQARPEHLPADNDLILLAFSLGRQDDPLKLIEPWVQRLRHQGRLVLLEWAPAAVLDAPQKQSLHNRLLSTLEENGSTQRPTTRMMTQWLQRSGLAHVRQSIEPSEELFTDKDRAFMAVEGHRMMEKLGLADESIAGQLGNEPLEPVPVAIAYGSYKRPARPLPDPKAEPDPSTAARAVAGAAEPGPSIAKLSAGGSLRELLAAVLEGDVDQPDEAAAALLRSYGSKAIGALSDPELIARESGLPLRAAQRLVQVLALGRRLQQPASTKRVEIHGPEDAFNYLADEMSSLTREYFRGLYLNVRGGLVADEVISIGTLTTALVHPREVFGPALEGAAHSLLIAHNHPSGDPNPSPEDINITRELADAGRLLGIELLDHIVIGRDSFVSLKERNHF